MITHKQFPNHHIFETEIGGRTFTVETGKVAELCNLAGLDGERAAADLGLENVMIGILLACDHG